MKVFFIIYIFFYYNAFNQSIYYSVGIDPDRVTVDEETDGWSAKGQISPPSTPKMLKKEKFKKHQQSSCDVMIEKEQ
jgi:hypothetical protein